MAATCVKATHGADAGGGDTDTNVKSIGALVRHGDPCRCFHLKQIEKQKFT
jgi:hypothetical protein